MRRIMAVSVMAARAMNVEGLLFRKTCGFDIAFGMMHLSVMVSK